MQTLLLLAVIGASDLRPNEAKDFSTVGQIQRHLEQREAELRAVEVSALPSAQRQSRMALLDRLHAYSQRGVFPHNHRLPGAQRPFFIDDHGTACAVGQLIIDSGHRELAERIRAEDNNGYLLEMKVDGLDAWVASSGFTALELAKIQPSYSYYPTQEGRVGVLKGGKVAFSSYVLVKSSAFEFQFNTRHLARAGETLYLGGPNQSPARVTGGQIKQIGEVPLTPKQAGSSVMLVGTGSIEFYDAAGTTTSMDLAALGATGVRDADARAPDDVFVLVDFGGLFHFDGKQLTLVATEESLQPRLVQVLALDDVWLLSQGELWRLIGQKLVRVDLPAGAAPVAVFGRGSAVYLAGRGPLLAWDGTAFAAVDSSAGTDFSSGAVAADGTVTAVGAKGAIAQGKAGGAWTRQTVATMATFSSAASQPDGSVLLGVDPTTCKGPDVGCPTAPKSSGSARGCSAAGGGLEVMLTGLGIWLAAALRRRA